MSAFPVVIPSGVIVVFSGGAIVTVTVGSPGSQPLHGRER